eukprot:gene26580-35248_t
MGRKRDSANVTLPKTAAEGPDLAKVSPVIVIDCSEEVEVPKLDTSTKLSRNDFSDIVAAAFNFPLSTVNSISNDEDQCSSTKLSLTPLEKQVENIRKQYSDSLLMVECGYRMRFFGDDAVVASRVLHIFAHKDHNFMVASIPTHRSVHHCRRLVSAGLKVAVVRQRETAALKKAMKTSSSSRGSTSSSGSTFDRAVDGVFTVGTLIDEDDPAFMDLNKLFHSKDGSKEDQPDGNADEDDEGEDPGADADDNNNSAPDTVDSDASDAWISAIVESGDSQKIGIVSVCVLSNEVKTTLLDIDEGRQQLADYLDLLQPVEVIAEQSISPPTKSIITMRCFQSVLASTGKQSPLVDPVIGAPSLSYIHRFLTLADEQFSSHTNNEGKQKLAMSMQGLSLSITKCVYGLRSYLKTFDLSSSLLQSSIQQWSVEPTLQNAGSLDSACSSDKAHELKTHHFTLDPVTIRDLDIVHVSSPLATTTPPTTASKKKSQSKDRSSLFWVLNNCCSLLGRRTLRSWLTHPLSSYTEIVKRQDLIGWIAMTSDEFNSLLGRRHSSNTSKEGNSNRGLWLKGIIGALKNRTCPDLERLLTSLQHGRISPRKLLQLLRFASTLQFLRAQQVQKLCDTPMLLQEMRIKFLAEIDALLESVDRFLQIINPTAAAQNCISEVIVYGHADSTVDDSDGHTMDIEEDEKAMEKEIVGSSFPFKPSAERISLLQRMRSAEQRLEDELRSIRTIVRNPSLQYKSLRSGPLSSIEGLVEVPVTQAHLKLPEDWVETNSTKQLRRYHVPQVVALNDDLQLIRDELDKDARIQWTKVLKLCDELLQSSLRKVCRFLGEMDCLISLAVVSALPGYTRPIYVENGDAIELTNARHPMVERYLERRGGTGQSDSHTTHRDDEMKDDDDHSDYKTNDMPTAAVFIPNDALLRCNFGDRCCQVVTGPNMGGKSSYVRMVALLCIMGQIGSSVPADCARLCVLDNIFTRMGAGDDLAAGMSTFMTELSRTSSILKQATCRSLVVLDELGRGTATNDGVAIALSTLRYMVEKIGCALLFVTHYPQVDGISSGSYGINVARIAGLSERLLSLARERSQWMLERCSLSRGNDDDHGDDNGIGDKKFASFIEAAANIVNRTTTVETSSGGAIHEC